MASADSPPRSDRRRDPRHRPVGLASRMLIVAASAVLLAFILARGFELWGEWRSLKRELSNVSHSAVIGYRNIHPTPSFAARPPGWFHDEGDSTFLWSGWTDNAGHQWFRVGRGEVERARVSFPIGRDVIRTIDHPLIERAGGPIWGRIPDDAPVVGQGLAGIMRVYPMHLLAKVGAVNDEVAHSPFLIVFNPSVPGDRAVHIYDPVAYGRRVTLGTTGYFHDGLPMFYDRVSESLWVEEPGSLHSIAGRSKGTRLRMVGQPSPVAWGDWRSRHPESQLVIGAER